MIQSSILYSERRKFPKKSHNNTTSMTNNYYTIASSIIINTVLYIQYGGSIFSSLGRVLQLRAEL